MAQTSGRLATSRSREMTIAASWLKRTRPRFCFWTASQLEHPQVHFETTAQRTADFPDLAMLVGCGSGGSLLGMGQRMKQEHRIFNCGCRAGGP